MEVRDHYALPLVCRKCGSAGVAECSEIDEEWSGPDFKVHSLPPGFIYSKESSFPQSAEISCEACDFVAN